MTTINDSFVVYITYVCLNLYILVHYGLSFTLSYGMIETILVESAADTICISDDGENLMRSIIICILDHKLLV